MVTFAYPDRYERDGVTHKTPQRPHGLLEAVQTSAPGEEIHLRGTVNGLDFAGSPGKARSVHRPEPIDVKIRGMGATNPGAVFRSAFFDDKGGGIARVAFFDMNVEAWPTQYPFVSVQNPRPGRIVFRRSRFTAPDGKVKSFVRTYNHAVAGTELSASDALEYLWYWTGSNAVLKGIHAQNMGRGVCQSVIRNVEGEFNGIPLTHLVTSPEDEVSLAGIRARGCGWDGSSAISITGHPGRVHISDLDIESSERTGAVYVRYNTKQNEQEPNVHWKHARAIDDGRINPDLRAQNEVTIDLQGSRIVLPHTDREPIFADSTSVLTIASDLETVVSSPKAALSLEENGHGRIVCPAGFPRAGAEIADKSIGSLVMTGYFTTWAREDATGTPIHSPLFMRRGASFDPAKYYTPRGS
ncbi:MAG: hypothetical protein VW405_00215 [Rhodospirillaceae bacterium]